MLPNQLKEKVSNIFREKTRLNIYTRFEKNNFEHLSMIAAEFTDSDITQKV